MDRSKKTVLLTGGTGFIGHHMIEHFLINTDWNIFVLDRYNYAGSLHRITDVLYGGDQNPLDCCPRLEPERVRMVFGDIRSDLGNVLPHIPIAPNYIVHAAAETHVDRSLTDPEAFVQSNVIGTFNMLKLARHFHENFGLEKFVHISTDEVYGPAPHGTDWEEWDRYRPSNPYSATKASADMLCMAWARSYGLPVLITHTMNNFGERQHPEKFVPLTMRRLLRGKPCIVHGLKGNVGSRKWLHARNHADAILFLLGKNTPAGDIVNVVGDVEMTNEEIVRLVAGTLAIEPTIQYVDFHSTRPGHDLRYSLDGTKLADMGWVAPITFDMSMRRTVRWTVDNQRWLMNDEDVERSQAA